MTDPQVSIQTVVTLDMPDGQQMVSTSLISGDGSLGHFRTAFRAMLSAHGYTPSQVRRFEGCESDSGDEAVRRLLKS